MKISDNMGRLLVLGAVQVVLVGYVVLNVAEVVPPSEELLWGALCGAGANVVCMIFMWRQWRRSRSDAD